ncbi:MAG: ABC transporter permease [Acidimicrobiia bacterium]
MDSRYAAVAAASVRSLAGNRRLFALRMLGDVGIVLMEALLPVFLVARFGSVAGWTAPEVALLIGLVRVGEGLSSLFGRAIDPFRFADTVRRGTFDQVLTRPVSPLAWMLTSGVEPRFIFRALAGTGVVAWAAAASGVPLTVANVAVLALAALGSAVLILSILVMGAALTFLTVEGSDLANVFANGAVSLSSFPLDVSGSVLRLTFTFLVPIGLCVYVPALVVLGRDGPGVLGPGLLPALPAVLSGIAGLAGLAWCAGLRRYTSTGS